ncbi:restriction endonuclease subunit S [Fusobacterium polymorphum]|uniref:restriction endonuclease subunit S n=1 Tax=Fusobacterium nucleatum subsp. polymorphum TaxID=76857 RepID=UPI00300A7A68
MAKNKKVEISLEEKLKKALIPVEEQPYKIPNNWVWTRLGEICEINPNKIKIEIDENELVDFIPMKNISEDSPEIIEKNFEKFKDLQKGYTQFIENDILFAKITPCMENGKTAIITDLKEKIGYGSTEFHILRSTKIINNKLLYNFLKQKRFRDDAKYNMTGSVGFRRVPTIFMKNYSFPLPPLDEQKRIVEKLDFLFDKTKKAKEIIEEIKVDIENRKISILDRAFKGVLTSKWRNENKVSDVKELLKSINDEKIKKWEEECLQAEKEGKKKPKKPTITEIEDMIVPVDEQPYKLPDSWVWVRLGEVVEVNPNKIKIDIGENELVDFIPMKNVSESSPEIIEKNFEKFKDLQKGYTQFIKNDILFAKITPCMENGKTAIISDLKEKIGYGSTEFHILRSTKIINNKLLYNFLKQKGFREDARYNMTGSVGFRRVPTEFMKSYPFPLPPLEEQQEIVRILDEVLENENKVKELLELEERIDVLEKSILNKAFKGELGTQNSNDEPAIELLKEIL